MSCKYQSLSCQSPGIDLQEELKDRIFKRGTLLCMLLKINLHIWPQGLCLNLISKIYNFPIILFFKLRRHNLHIFKCS